MEDRLRRAAANNAGWCDLVCRSHGVPTATGPDVWFALQRAPELYPDAVTLQPGVVVEEVLQSVRDGPGCSVKDSFAELDFARLGFVELFEAQWFWHEPEPARWTGSLTWTVVDSDAELARWADAAGLSGTIRGELLHESSVRILAACGSSGVVGGAIANRTGSVVGVSNVFAATVPANEVWLGIADAVAGVFPSMPIVGYEQGDGLRAAIATGFTSIGGLRVWRRPLTPR
jgi:hypothetical protein